MAFVHRRRRDGYRVALNRCSEQKIGVILVIPRSTRDPLGTHAVDTWFVIPMIILSLEKLLIFEKVRVDPGLLRTRDDGRWDDMKKKRLTNKAGQVRELTRKDIRAMRPANEVLPTDLLGVLPKRKVGQRGPQKQHICGLRRLRRFCL